MSPFIIIFFNSIAFAIYCFLGSRIILYKKKYEAKKIIIASISLIASYYYILCILDSIYAMFFSGLCAFLFIKIIFKESIYMSGCISLILTTVKLLFKILILQILNNKKFLLYNTYKTLNINACYINLTSIFFSLLFFIIFRKLIWKIINYISRLKHRKLLLLIFILANFSISFFYQPPYETISLRMLADTLIIIGVTTIGIFNISSEMKMENLMNHYHEIYDYSKSNVELIKQYKMQVHENKNKLLMIREMLNSSVKETKKYIDSILKEMQEEQKYINYWFLELQYIPLPGIRNFINYKLTKMKELNAEIEIFISSELENIIPSNFNDNDYNQLTTILGVILDNMIESLKETEDKLVSINIYIDDNKIHCEFVNSFSGNVDLNRLNEVGYTTKGEQHGVGLPLVLKILEANKRFECTPNIIDNFFKQHLTIQLFSKENLPKKTKN